MVDDRPKPYEIALIAIDFSETAKEKGNRIYKKTIEGSY